MTGLETLHGHPGWSPHFPAETVPQPPKVTKLVSAESELEPRSPDCGQWAERVQEAVPEGEAGSGLLSVYPGPSPSSAAREAEAGAGTSKGQRLPRPHAADQLPSRSLT